MRRTMILAALLVAGCTDPDGAKRAAESAGLTDVKVGGWTWLGCGRDDQYHTRFTAKNAQGHLVTGTVCGGWLKGNTIRFD